MGMQGIIPPNINYNKNISDGYQIRPYTAGETCIHNNTLYKAKQDITVAEDWNPDHWKETTVEQELSAVNTKIANITPDDTAVDGKPWTSKHIVDMLCPPLKVSGNPVQCYPVAGYPLGITASWEPTQEGTGDPSPENIRPIKGRDSVAVTRCGANILDPADFENSKTVNGITFNNLNNGSVEIKGTASRVCFYNVVKSFPSVITINKDGSYVSGDYIISVTGLTDGVIIVRTSDKAVMYIRVSAGSIVDTTVSIQIEIGSVATEYTPYTGDTTTLTLPETIYGGSVDAVSGEGESLYNKANLRMEKLEYNKNISAMLGYASQNLLNEIQLPPSNSIRFDGVCDYLPTKPASEINSGAIGLGVSASGDIYLKAEGLDSAEAYAAKFPNGVNVCYKVATPTSFSATGNTPVKALSGVNTVLTDADTAEVTGRKDLIHAITGQ